jgi:hypothetical protein
MEARTSLDEDIQEKKGEAQRHDTTNFVVVDKSINMKYVHET